MKLVLVSAALLLNSQGQCLLTQRPPGKSMVGLWEFPGGKIEQGETPEEALIRELKEELSISIDIADLSPLNFASHTYETFHLLMPVFICRRWKGEICPREGQAFLWVAMDNIKEYSMPPADEVLIDYLVKIYSISKQKNPM